MRKILSTTIAAGIFVSMGISPVFADVAANALPSFNHGTNVDVTTTGNNMNIQIQGGASSVGTAYWNSFNIGKDAGVNVEFTAHNQTSLNYVDAAGGMSQIYGNFTNSGCFNCGYEATGKVLLINPNGILFGDGANVNLNSFTASTMNGTYNNTTKTLELERTGNSKGIIVQNGAKIYGDKNVALASDNISLYKGSQISTNTVALNTDTNSDRVNDTALGKVKLVTSDGVNFTYYNNGAIDSVNDVQASADKMTLWIAGDVTSGHIDARNASTHAGSELNTNEAVLKAYKAEKGSDGNIWLTANNRAITEKTTFITANATEAAASREGGNVLISSANKTTLNADAVNAVGNVVLTASNGDVNVDNSAIQAANVGLKSSNIASIQNGSYVKASNVVVLGDERAQIVGGSKVDADNIGLAGGNVWFDKADLNATNEIDAIATEGYILSDGTSSFNANSTELTANTNVTGSYNLNNKATTIKAGKDIDVTLYNVSNKNAGLVAEADNDVTIETDGTLSVSRLVAKNGDMTITADNVVKGLPYNNMTNTGDEVKFEGDTNDRALISVRNGKFNSNVANNNFEVTQSGGSQFVKDGVTYNVKHNIQYGANGEEKVLLINPRPAADVPSTPASTIANVDTTQADMLNKMPRQQEVYNNATNISDGRTTFVDVFAAASQIEIEDEEE